MPRQILLLIELSTVFCLRGSLLLARTCPTKYRVLVTSSFTRGEPGANSLLCIMAYTQAMTSREKIQGNIINAILQEDPNYFDPDPRNCDLPPIQEECLLSSSGLPPWLANQIRERSASCYHVSHTPSTLRHFSFSTTSTTFSSTVTHSHSSYDQHSNRTLLPSFPSLLTTGTVKTWWTVIPNRNLGKRFLGPPPKPFRKNLVVSMLYISTRRRLSILDISRLLERNARVLEYEPKTRIGGLTVVFIVRFKDPLKKWSQGIDPEQGTREWSQ